MKTKQLLITPEVASRLLEQNTGNFRGMKPNLRDRYAKAMSAGQWYERNGESIKIGKDNIVQDGQHRLHAIVKSGVSLLCLIVYDLEPEAAMTQDTGNPRAVADWVRHTGVKNANAVSAIARMCCVHNAGQWTYQGFHPSSTLTNTDILNYVSENEDALQGAHFLAMQCKSMVAGSILGSILMIAAGGRNPAENPMCIWFSESLSKGANLSGEEPVLHLRNKLQVPTHKKETPYVQRMLTNLAWNKTVKGETCKLLKFSMTGPAAMKPIDIIELAPWND